MSRFNDFRFKDELFSSCAMALILLLFPLHAHAGLVIDKQNQDLTAVPQNIDKGVRTLRLGGNSIEEIDHTSFPLFTLLCCLNMNGNPLMYIRENTFKYNGQLQFFGCGQCNIKSLPTNYGPCTSIFTTLTARNGIDPSAVSTIFRYPYFRAFTSLRSIGLAHLPLKNMANLELPPSTKKITVVSAELTTFPNLTSSSFPKLIFLNITENPINIIPDDIWQNVTDSLQILDISQTGLSAMVDLTLRPNLQEIHMSNNHLETIPDLLNMISLTTLKIAGNSRMSCDRRLCWRRLWDRVREPLASYDDVTCVQPSELTGYKLSVVNPEIMDCAKGINFQYMKELCPQIPPNLYHKSHLNQQKNVGHWTVVRSSPPVGAARTTSSFSTYDLALMDWANATAKQDRHI